MTSCGVAQLLRCSEGSQRRQSLVVVDGKREVGRLKSVWSQGVPPRS